jgi:hypothetical protein
MGAFNRTMKHVTFDKFIFDDADYAVIARKELAEVGDIF